MKELAILLALYKKKKQIYFLLLKLSFFSQTAWLFKHFHSSSRAWKIWQTECTRATLSAKHIPWIVNEDKLRLPQFTV